MHASTLRRMISHWSSQAKSFRGADTQVNRADLTLGPRDCTADI